MSKVLRTAAQVVGAVVAIAAAIPTGGTSLLAYGLGVSAATASLIALGTVVATSLITSLTTPKPTVSTTGSPEQWAADPEGRIPYILGRFGLSGSIVTRVAWDTSDKGANDRQAIVTVLSGAGPIAGIDGLTFDGLTAPNFDGSGNETGTYSGWLWSVSQLGLMVGAAAMAWPSGFGTPPGWTSNSLLTGMAAVGLGFRYDTTGEHWQAGLPSPKWVARGVLCYDPRKDSTYPGGSGSHRWADPADTAAFDAAQATWEYSDNPYLHGLRWSLGTWERDRTDPSSTYTCTFGMGAPWQGVDVAAFVEGANVAYLHGWKIGGAAYSGDPKWNTLKSILQAGMGEPIMLGAKISCFVNAPKVVLASVGPGDFDGDVSVQGTQSIRDRINRVVPRYYQEGQTWQLLPGTPVEVTDYRTADKGRRSKTIDYPFIPDADGTDQIATACRYDIENSREFGPITLPLRLRYVGYKPGDCISVTYPEVGLVNQPVLLTQRSLAPDKCTPTFTARSETAAKHAYALGQTSVAPPTPGVSGPPLVPVPGATAWSISASYVAAGGQTVPALVVTGAVDSTVAEAINVEYRQFVSGQAADINWIAAATLQPAAQRLDITSIIPDTAYEVAISYRRRGVTGARLIIGPVTTAQDPLLAEIIALTSDDVLSKAEKPQVFRDWTALSQNHSALDAKGALLGLAATERATANTKMGALATYLSSLSPGWLDTSQDTSIVAADFQSNWTDATDAVAALQAAIQGTPGIDALTVNSSPAGLNVACDSTGAPKSGEFNKTAQLQVVVASTDQTTNATYSIPSGAAVGCTASVSNASGSQGLVTFTGISVDHAYVDVTVTLGTYAAVVKRITLDKVRDGASGSSGPTPYIATPIGMGTISYASGSAIVLATGQTVTLHAQAIVTAAGGSPVMTLQAQYSTTGTGGFVNMTSGSITHTVNHGDTDPITVDGTYTNASGGDQLISFQTVLSNSGGTPSVGGNSYMQPVVTG